MTTETTENPMPERPTWLPPSWIALTTYPAKAAIYLDARSVHAVLGDRRAVVAFGQGQQTTVEQSPRQVFSDISRATA